MCFGLYFANYRSWQAEIFQERAEGCILQKKIYQDFLFCGFVGVVINSELFKIFLTVPKSIQRLGMEWSLLSTVRECCDARSVLLFHLNVS